MKKIILGVLVASIVLSGCTKPAVINEIKDKVEDKKESVKRSLKDLVASGVAQKCTWKFDDGNSSAEGTMWMSGKKFKQEIKSIAVENKKESRTTVVVDGKYTYMWSNEMGNKGIKMEITDDQNQDYSAENGKVDWNSQYQYECNPASVSDADLAPPKDIEFQDLGAQLKELQKLQEKYQDR